jgi:hypothetical protein
LRVSAGVTSPAEVFAEGERQAILVEAC